MYPKHVFLLYSMHYITFMRTLSKETKIFFETKNLNLKNMSKFMIAVKTIYIYPLALFIFLHLFSSVSWYFSVDKEYLLRFSGEINCAIFDTLCYPFLKGKTNKNHICKKSCLLYLTDVHISTLFKRRQKINFFER